MTVLVAKERLAEWEHPHTVKQRAADHWRANWKRGAPLRKRRRVAARLAEVQSEGERLTCVRWIEDHGAKVPPMPPEVAVSKGTP